MFDPETGEEYSDIETNVHNAVTNSYNMWLRPEKPRQQYNLSETGQQSTYTAYSKPQAHIMITQMSILTGIEKFGQKGNDMLLK